MLDKKEEILHQKNFQNFHQEKKMNIEKSSQKKQGNYLKMKEEIHKAYFNHNKKKGKNNENTSKKR